jgi:uncharacterized cupin superfamily protein
MAFRVLPAAEAVWRPSNQMGVLNTDLAKQLGAETLGARLWRLKPGQASTRHRHTRENELYVLLEGRGRVRIGDELLTLDPPSALYVEAETVRQLFNDTERFLVCTSRARHPREACRRAESVPVGARCRGASSL